MTNPTDRAGSASPDNLADPQGYQRHLLGLVGYDDPAAVQEVTRLRRDLEDVDLDLGSGELSDDPDFASRVLARMPSTASTISTGWNG